MSRHAVIARAMHVPPTQSHHQHQQHHIHLYQPVMLNDENQSAGAGDVNSSTQVMLPHSAFYHHGGGGAIPSPSHPDRQSVAGDGQSPSHPGNKESKSQRPGRGGNSHRPDTLPLEEAAKREMQLLTAKTPVSILQELLSRRGSLPKYDLVQVEGAVHEPTFRYRVSVGEFLAMGTGRSKKEAKHAAAKAVLEKITASSFIQGNNINEVMASMGNGNDESSNIGNPIGVLQELCMSRRWPPPAYETEYEEGLPHERLFTISCVVFKHKETGTGKSKKVAKRLAALNMWHKLKNIPLESSSGHWGEMLDEEDVLTRNIPEASALTSEWDELKHAKISTVTPQHTLKIAQFHKNLKSATGPHLNKLQESAISDNINCVQFLQEIAAEQKFDVTYVDVEEKSRSEKFQCLVQISTLPVAVVHGSGNTSEEAQMAAAMNALQYLKIMTKKK